TTSLGPVTCTVAVASSGRVRMVTSATGASRSSVMRRPLVSVVKVGITQAPSERWVHVVPAPPRRAAPPPRGGRGAVQLVQSGGQDRPVSLVETARINQVVGELVQVAERCPADGDGVVSSGGREGLG